MLRTALSIFTIMIFGFSGVVFADTVYMKDGTVMEGKIINKDAGSVTIMQGRIPRKFYLDLVDRVEYDVTEEPDQRKEGLLGIDPASFEGIPAEKVGLILQLLEINGTRYNIEKKVTEVVAAAPPEQQATLVKFFQTAEVIRLLVPVYDKHFRTAELRELVKFYQSWIGQRLLDVTPRLMVDIVDVTTQYFQKKIGDR